MRESARRQLEALDLAESARTREEQDRAHVAMVQAFPRLAAAYPCHCHACMAERTK